MNYYELRHAVSRIVPRMTQLQASTRRAQIVREKGRKKNYSQFDLQTSTWERQERLLKTEQINSFLEISCRAAACPMPYNGDVWDGLVCIAEGQNVKTKRGSIPIEEVKSGDVVLSFNETTKALEWKSVTTIKSKTNSNMVELVTESGKTLLLTDDHPVYTINRGWVPAGKLVKDDELLES